MIRILGIPLHDGTFERAVNTVVGATSELGVAASRCVSASGAHGLTEARRDPAFAGVLRSFWMNLPDGVPVVWLGRLEGARSMERCYGPDFFREVMLATASTSVKHFFCGGKEGVAEELKSVVERKFGNRSCVGTFSPPFREMSDGEWQELEGRINAVKPDIVWIGLSTPKQELFARELSRRVKVRLIITIGAAFDIHTGHLPQAPRVMQRLGLEWLFRLAVEPRRLWRRYARVVPLFLYYAGEDLLTRRGRSDSNKE
jgi:N-acetylglucosaminyldiphosphoundecaprenol N-acetyl-beta-D-mannosaminyltransferase